MKKNKIRKKATKKLSKKVHDIQGKIKAFKKESSGDQRLASYDFCYLYFYKHQGKKLTRDIEKSCSVLVSFLASWGMYRGSSVLRTRSTRTFIPLIKWIATCDPECWQITPDRYTDHWELLHSTYKAITEKLDISERAHKVLVTKIMMAVFGCVPAYDRYFCKAFKKISGKECAFTSFNKKSLQVITQFYEDNKTDINRQARISKLRSFDTGRYSSLTYSPAKIIDMYGYQRGRKMK